MSSSIRESTWPFARSCKCFTTCCPKKPLAPVTSKENVILGHAHYTRFLVGFEKEKNVSEINIQMLVTHAAGVKLRRTIYSHIFFIFIPTTQSMCNSIQIGKLNLNNQYSNSLYSSITHAWYTNSSRVLCTRLVTCVSCLFLMFEQKKTSAQIQHIF